MNLLQRIEEKLKELDPNVYYGLADRQNKWDYIVYARDKTEVNSGLTSKSVHIRVAVVRENYIEEDMEEKLLEAMKAIPGLKKTQEPVVYTYLKKPNTNTIVEIMEMEFAKAVRML